MNGIDTNVLLRFLVADDAAQAVKARRYIESGPSYVNCIVLSEVVGDGDRTIHLHALRGGVARAGRVFTVR